MTTTPDTTDAQWLSVLRLIEDMPVVAAYVTAWKDHPSYGAVVTADAVEVAKLLHGLQIDSAAAIAEFQMAENWAGRFTESLVGVFVADDAAPAEVGQFVIDRSRAEVAIFDDWDEDDELPAKSDDDGGAA